jgi:hypothetical protein
MSGRTGRQKQQRILFAHRIRFFDLAKQIVGVSELRLELLAHFGSDIVAASVNSRADGSFDIPGQRAKATEHFPHAFFNDAFDCAAPTCVKHSHGSLLGVDEDDGQAIGGLDSEQNAGHARDEPIANKRFLRQVTYAVDEIGVNLTQSNQRPFLLAAASAKLLQESRSVAFDRAAGILFGESKVESVSPESPRKSANSRTESMNQPWNAS